VCFFSSFLEESALALPCRLCLSTASSINVADLTDEAEESFIDVCTCLCGCFEEGAVVIFSSIGTLLVLDLALVGKIAFVAAEDHWDVVDVLDTEDLFAEGCDFIEGAAGSDSVNEEEALASAHVLIAHCAVLLLAGGIKDIEEGGLTVDCNLLPVAILDGRIVLINEVVLDQLDSKGGLADTTTTNNDNLVFSHLLYIIMYVFLQKKKGLVSTKKSFCVKSSLQELKKPLNE